MPGCGRPEAKRHTARRVCFDSAGRASQKSGGVLLSRKVAPEVPSALEGLTTLFGMGRGVTPLKSPTPTEDRDRTVSRRSEPSSRTALMGEQPNPRDLLQPQDAMSRHRGAKPSRRCGLLGRISLLSPEYLLSVERPRFHSPRPDH